MSNEFKPFMTRQIEGGKWECYHHAIHELTATGETESEAQSKVLTMCETVIGVNHTNLERWYDRAKAAEATLEKARAVLAEHSETVKDADYYLDSVLVVNRKPLAELIVALADALGGEHEHVNHLICNHHELARRDLPFDRRRCRKHRNKNRQARSAKAKAERERLMNQISKDHQNWLLTMNSPPSMKKGKRADCAEQNLGALDFSGAVLKFAIFLRADLEGADFSGADLEGVSFVSANLKNANFAGAHFDNTSFHWANIEGANFEDADLSQAEFYEAQGKNSWVSDVMRQDEDDWQNPDQNPWMLSGAELKKCKQSVGGVQ